MLRRWGGGFNAPNDVAVDGSGNVYVADGELKEMPPGCASTSCVTSLGDEDTWIAGVAVDRSGNIYVANESDQQVQEILRQGLNFGTVALGATGPTETLAFDFNAADSGIEVSVVTQGAKGA